MAQSNLHLDILMGRDETIEPVDIFGGELSFLLCTECIFTLPCLRDGEYPAPRYSQRHGKETQNVILLIRICFLPCYCPSPQPRPPTVTPWIALHYFFIAAFDAQSLHSAGAVVHLCSCFVHDYLVLSPTHTRISKIQFYFKKTESAGVVNELGRGRGAGMSTI